MNILLIVILSVLIKAQEYELLAQQDTSQCLFDKATLTAAGFDQGVPTDDCYSNIGTVSAKKDEYRNENGDFAFRLRYYGGSPDVELVWTQQSWIQESSVIGADLSQLPTQTGANPFRGLALSNEPIKAYCSSCAGCWWNAVVSFVKYGAGIPANNGQSSIGFTLEILESEDSCSELDCESQSDGCTSVTCDAATAQCVSTPIVTCPANKVCVDGYCSRDCDAFKIDDFLRDCSAEFDGNEGDISTLQTQVTALEIDLAEGGATEGRLDSIEAAITSNDGEIAAIEAELAGPIGQRFDTVEGEVQAIADGLAGATEQRFVTIETEITGINSRLDDLDAQTAPGGVVEVRFESIEATLGKFSAHSQTGNVIGESIERTADSFWISAAAKDKLFMFLLILNTVLIVGLAIVCVLLNKSRNSTKYQKIYSTETDDENQRLQR